jgi:hypothetical protein
LITPAVFFANVDSRQTDALGAGSLVGFVRFSSKKINVA